MPPLRANLPPSLGSGAGERNAWAGRSPGPARRPEPLSAEHPFARRTLTAALGLLCELRGADLLRAKGLVAVEGCRGPVVVHAVRHVLHPPAELEAWPDPGDRRSRLVFVTRGGLARGQVLDLFHAVTALAPPEKAPSP